jgi:ABC-type sulfate transport system substrate-binding protein
MNDRPLPCADAGATGPRQTLTIRRGLLNRVVAYVRAVDVDILRVGETLGVVESGLR